jgi:hypothetical protein
VTDSIHSGDHIGPLHLVTPPKRSGKDEKKRGRRDDAGERTERGTPEPEEKHQIDRKA